MQQLLKLLLGNRQGASAVEFALVAPVFLALVMILAEVSVICLIQLQVDSATSGLQRMLLTNNTGSGFGTNSGSGTGAVTPQVAIETAICQALIPTGVLQSDQSQASVSSLCQCLPSKTNCAYYRFPTTGGMRYCVYPTIPPTTSTFTALLGTGGSAPTCPTTSPPTGWVSGSTVTIPTDVAIRLDYDWHMITPALSIVMPTLTIYGFSAAQMGLS